MSLWRSGMRGHTRHDDRISQPLSVSVPFTEERLIRSQDEPGFEGFRSAQESVRMLEA